MLDTLILKVEGMIGSSIEGVAQQMVQLAKKLDLFVETEFNGITLIAAPYSDPEDLVETYCRSLSLVK